MVANKVSKKVFVKEWIKRYCRVHKIRYKGADHKAIEQDNKKAIDNEWKLNK